MTSVTAPSPAPSFVARAARLASVLLFGVVACTASSRSTETAASPNPEPAATQGAVSEAPTTANPDEGGATPAAGCRTDADCGAEAVCEGEGCGEVLGQCMPKARACTRDAQSYCDCEGVTFIASGKCPNRRFAHRGPCEAAGTPKPDGSPCEQASECESGVCEGEGCDVPGVCVAKSRPCTKDLRQYCGCDGKTFQGSGSCPGARFSKRAPC